MCYLRLLDLKKSFSILSHLKDVNPLYEHVQNVQEILPENAFDIRFVDDEDVDFLVIGNESTEQSVEVSVKFFDNKDVQIIANFGEDGDFENENPIDRHCLGCVETTLISKCPHVVVDDENIIVAPGEGPARA